MTAAVTSVPELWHLKVSNYNEKVRWALDYKGVPHVRRAATAGRHQQRAQRLWGRDTLPVLVVDGKPIGDSTRIIEELERRHPEPPLYPSDPALRERAVAIEEFFDEDVGPFARLLAVHHLLPDSSLLLATFTPDLRTRERIVLRAAYPVLRRRLERQFGIDDHAVEHAFAKLRAGGERFAAEVQPSGYLVGDRFSVADLTAAALVAPLVAPPEFPYPQPQRDHPRLADVRALMAESGWLDWVHEMYARHRGRSAAVADLVAA